MGVSTNGQICFGIAFEEGVEFPWDDEGGGIESWWYDVVLGYEPPFQIYQNGDYIGGVKPPEERINAYYQAKRDFREAQPAPPIEVVMHCSGDYPMWILAVKGTVLTARRGYPEEIDFEQLQAAAVSGKQTLIDFCTEYGIEAADVPRWWLSSLWW